MLARLVSSSRSSRVASGRARAKTASLAVVFILALSFLGSLVMLNAAATAQTATTVTGVGQWTETTDYGAASGNTGSGGAHVLGVSCVVYESDVYCVGGQNSVGTDTSNVYYAPISSTGLVGGWTETTDYGAASGSSGSGGVGIEWPSCVVYDGYIYCVAGATSGTPSILSKVFYSQITSNGVGPWTETTDYGASSGATGSGGLPEFQLACVEDGGYIYCTGGGGSKVFYAQLSSSGVGPWTETTDYGAASGDSGSGGVSIDSNACVDSTGYIYCIGGTSASYKPVSDVFYAPLSSSGVGPWTETTDYGATSGASGTGGLPIYGTACVSFEGNIVCVDGDSTGNNATNAIGFAKDQAIGYWDLVDEFPELAYWFDCVDWYGGGLSAYIICYGASGSQGYSAELLTPSVTESSSPTSMTTPTSLSTTEASSTSSPSVSSSSSSTSSSTPSPTSASSSASIVVSSTQSSTTTAQGLGFPPYIWLVLIAALILILLLGYAFLKGGVTLAGDKGDENKSDSDLEKEKAKKAAKDKLKDYAKDKVKDWIKDQIKNHLGDFLPDAPATWVAKFPAKALGLIYTTSVYTSAYTNITDDIHGKLFRAEGNPDVGPIVNNNIKFDKKDTTLLLLLLLALRFRAQRLKALADGIRQGAIKPTDEDTDEKGVTKYAANHDIPATLEQEASLVDQAADQVNSELNTQLKEK